MRSVNVLLKGLLTVKTLGCVNIIYSNKTGTLTENKISVTSISFVNKYKNADNIVLYLVLEHVLKTL